ncbi:MAG: hypothetical protein P1P84_02670 [Deferrisomatales bacterium]|nr:hypothetical protein [Deferrisomatales bacterium]
MTVAELFARVLPRLKLMPPSIAFVDAAQAVQDVIARRLWEARSDLLRDPWESDTHAIGTTTVDLPELFLGVADELPFLEYTSGGSTQIATLRPLSRPRSHYVTAADAVPAEYEIRGSLVQLYPTTTVAFTLHMPMYARPPALESMDDDLPWNGTYDHLFQDSVLHLAGPAGIMTMVSPHLEQAIMRAVDTGAALRTGRKVQWAFA